MARRATSRYLLPLVIVAATYACNVYTEDLFLDDDETTDTGGESTGAAAASGGTTGGRSSSGGTGGLGTGGIVEGGTDAQDTGGSPSGGGTLSGGAPESGGSGPAGGTTSGGAISGGAGLGGTGDGGAATGGSDAGGTSPGGAETGGAETGGAPTAGAPAGGTETGGAATGGEETGGAETGGEETGGAPTGGSLPVGFVEVDLLDVANNAIELSNGEGFWYVFHDDTTDAVIAPDTQRDTSLKLIPEELPAPRGNSLLGVHIVADNGFTEWGAGVGFDLNSPNSTTKNEYDLRPYAGISFWARSAASSVDMRLRVITADITPTDEPGGTCTSSCSDAFGQVVTLTTTWREITVDFSSPPLEQEGWGYSPPAFDPSVALAIQLQAGPGVAFDIWLDDILFYE